MTLVSPVDFSGLIRIPLAKPVSNDDLVRIGHANPGWRVERLGTNVIVIISMGRKGGNRNQRFATLREA